MRNVTLTSVTLKKNVTLKCALTSSRLGDLSDIVTNILHKKKNQSFGFFLGGGGGGGARLGIFWGGKFLHLNTQGLASRRFLLCDT